MTLPAPTSDAGNNHYRKEDAMTVHAPVVTPDISDRKVTGLR